MFGYIRPAVKLLDEAQQESYRSIYCGLCHTLGRRYGWIARLTLNYDYTFLALLLHACSTQPGECRCRRCAVHPLRKPTACACGTALEQAADESMILTWYKLCDDVEDDGFFAALPKRILRRLLRRAYAKAAQARPEFDAVVRDKLARLRQQEIERSPHLDQTADLFAGILAAAAREREEHGQSTNGRALEQLLYHLGRWIYLLDAWDDLEEDAKHDRYNPLNARFDGQAVEQKAYVNTTLTHSRRLMLASANLMELGSWSAVVENVLEYSMPTIQQAVLDGRWDEVRRAKEKKA